MINNGLFQKLTGRVLEEKGIQLIIKREDLFFPEIPGNKWRKLKYNLEYAQSKGFASVLSFGGAYSNHLSALAAAGRINNMQTIGIVRGEEPNSLNPTLSGAIKDGMQLIFSDRETYRQYTQKQEWVRLRKTYPDAYIIPEGGTNLLALKGCREIVDDIPEPYDFVCCPAGTGGTAGGILCGINQTKNVLVFSALKGDFLREDINQLTLDYNNTKYKNWSLITEYHFGGYAKHKVSLLNFMLSFYEAHKIPLDPIYTGKMMYGIFDLIKKDSFPKGSRIIAIHTGGLQGIAGFNQRYGTLLPD